MHTICVEHTSVNSEQSIEWQQRNRPALWPCLYSIFSHSQLQKMGFLPPNSPTYAGRKLSEADQALKNEVISLDGQVGMALQIGGIDSVQLLDGDVVRLS